MQGDQAFQSLTDACTTLPTILGFPMRDIEYDLELFLDFGTADL